MCGIAGGIGFGLDVIEAMTESLRHRGPDSAGIFCDGDFSMGHRRLAILDLSDAGRQPMISRDGRFVIALNGELLNYLELRNEIGGEFRTESDTEVLLEACAKWGVEQALERSIGMFAFALWDRRERELTLARDRMGEKPLVYFEDRGRIAFASEMKSLASVCGRRLDAEAVDAYFALGHVPAPLGIFRGTHKLPAGCMLQFKDGRSRLRRWWNAAEHSNRELRATVRDAVRLRLRSDVPVALCLSGGVDSSVIAAECVKLGVDLAAFTVAFDGEETDVPYARRVASQLGLRHELLQATADAPERIFEHYDEPFADSSAVGALALARAMNGRYKVVLTGDGGDEAFGGYRHYEFIGAKQAIKRAAAAAGVVDGAGARVYVESRVAFRARERQQLMNGNWRGNALHSIPHAARGSALRRAMAIDRDLELANRLTYKMDIALGAMGMEGRAPFLDHRVMEWSNAAPQHALVRGRDKKIALRAAYRGEIPDAALDRPKQGFGAPVEKWLAGAWREFVADVTPCALLDSRAQREASGQRLWTIAAFAAWARKWKATW